MQLVMVGIQRASEAAKVCAHTEVPWKPRPIALRESISLVDGSSECGNKHSHTGNDRSHFSQSSSGGGAPNGKGQWYSIRLPTRLNLTVEHEEGEGVHSARLFCQDAYWLRVA